MPGAALQVGSLPPGNAGAKRTADLTALQARRAARNPTVRELAGQLRELLNVGAAQAARAAHRFVRDSITFEPDPPDVELIRGPEVILRERRGDCDDKAALLAGLLRALGLRVRLRLTRSDQLDANRYSHVYPEVLLAQGWTPADPTFPGTPFGVHAAPSYGEPYVVEV